VLGSQALDVLIGVALTMSIVALASSTIVEMIAAGLRWRAKMLEDALLKLVEEGTPKKRSIRARKEDPTQLATTTVVKSLAGPGRAFPSYISSAAFVDAVAEVSQDHNAVPRGIERRLQPAANRGQSPANLRATLERHFDEAMERLSGAYKRRAMVWLFAVGVGIAAIGNVSVYHIAQSLWSDTTTRQAVVQAAKNVDPDGIDASDLDSVGATVSQLEDIGVPVGWTERAKADWGKARTFPLTRVGMILGWLLTGVLVTLGAPFWFDLLSRLVALRSSGDKPKSTEPVPGIDSDDARPRAIAGTRGAPAVKPDKAINAAFGLP
jgi:hypothetical protein